MSGAINIPYQQSPDPVVNQIQQFVNRVNNNFNSQIVELQAQVNEMIAVGMVILAGLSLNQFQAKFGKTWILANGQSAVGTDYFKQTGNETVPNVSVAGVNAFVKVNE